METRCATLSRRFPKCSTVFIAQTCAFRTRANDVNTHTHTSCTTLHRFVEIEINEEKYSEIPKNVMFETDGCMPFSRLLCVSSCWCNIRLILGAASSRTPNCMPQTIKREKGDAAVRLP